MSDQTSTDLTTGEIAGDVPADFGGPHPHPAPAPAPADVAAMREGLERHLDGLPAEPRPRAEATEVASELQPVEPAPEAPTIEEKIAKIKNRFWMRARLRLDAPTDQIMNDSVLLSIVLAVHQELQETGVEDWDKWMDAEPGATNDYIGYDIEDASKS